MASRPILVFFWEGGGGGGGGISDMSSHGTAI